MAVTVLSRTLWIGHISKQTTEEELQQELNRHGEATVMVRALSLMCSSSSCNPLDVICKTFTDVQCCHSVLMSDFNKSFTEVSNVYSS